MDEKKKREQANIEIVDYQPKYRKVFKELNEEWIDHYFELEEEDRKLLDNPEKNILDKKGFIFIALYKGEPVGTCALVPINDPDYDYELGKMGVAPTARGLGIGWLLGEATVDKAKSLGCKKIYLESNTVLAPAIRLYEKMGFVKIIGHPSPYARCNIQMELDLMGE
jgi:GNAT superfamily N-acetyltransferase